MEMTVLEYLTFAAELKKIPSSEREGQLKAVMELTKLQDVSMRLIQNLSKGYKQRVGLAQAILGFPEIIILDEPTVGLDPKQIIEIREMIRKLAKNHTVILSSHILAEVREVCDYIMIISGGKLVASDNPENLEKKIGGDGVTEIQVRATVEEVKEILSGVPGMGKVEFTDHKNGLVTAKIESSAGQDIREELFFAFAGKGVPLLELTRTKTTLEEIFLELTQGNIVESEEQIDGGDI